MIKKSVSIMALIIIFVFGLQAAAAQITIKIPKVPKVEKPKTEQPKSNDNGPTQVTTGPNNSPSVKKDSKHLYENQRPTSTPVLLKNSIYVQAKTHDEYWKFPNQRDYSSWVPLIRFNEFYNNEKSLNFTVEYFNPDGSLWYSEKMEQNNLSADRTVTFQSPSPYGGVLDTKSTVGTGVYSFKITNQDTREVLYQGKFKVGKFSRAYRPEEKNKADFYVEHDWLLPFGMIGFHFSDVEIGGVMPEVSVWLKGMVNADQLEGRIFYKGQQIASTKDGVAGSGVSDYDERATQYAPAFAPQNIWKRWQFQWGKFLVDNNGGYNPDNYPGAHYADKNPGDYTVKIYRGGVQIRELSFAVGTDGRFVAPSYTNQIFLPYYALILPVKVMGAEKWDAMAWKTDAFYGNPLSGFEIR